MGFRGTFAHVGMGGFALTTPGPTPPITTHGSTHINTPVLLHLVAKEIYGSGLDRNLTENLDFYPILGREVLKIAKFVTDQKPTVTLNGGSGNVCAVCQ